MIPQRGLTTILKDKMANIEAKARAFLMSDDKIGFIAKLMQDSPTEVAPIVNAGRRIAGEQKAMMMAQAQGTQPSVTENNLKAITEPVTVARSGGAISSLPIKDSMFRAAGGGIVAFANGGGIQPNFYPGLPGVNRAQAIENEKRKRIMEAEREANKQGKTLFAPRRNPGFVDFLGEDSPITTPSLPPGQAYTPGIFGLMRGQLANQKAAEAVDTPRPQLSQADIQAIASGDKTAQDVDLSRAADIDPLKDAMLSDDQAKLTDLQRLEKFAGSGDTGKGPKNLLKDDFTPTMVDTGLMGKEERKAPDRIQFEFTDADTLLKEAQETADSIFKKVEGSDDFANPEKAVADTRAFFEKSGVDLTNAAQKAALDKQEALLAKDKKEGAMYALLEFGFGLMAGKSPNALTNVGEAGKAVAPRLFQLQKDIRKGNERLTDARLKLAELENAQKMGIAKVSMERIEKEKERIARANDRLMQTKASFINSFMQNRRMLETSKLSAMTNLQTAQMRVEAQDRATQAQLDKVTRAKLVDDALKLPEPERTERLEEISRAYIRPDPFASLGERLRTAGKGVGLEDKEITALENRLGLTQIK
tara:strand:- start:486 stop:2258 length:1773 start_codon:yes stop_codon:yes gene_type:complete